MSSGVHSAAGRTIGPRRTCVGCRQRAALSDLIRVVVVFGACVPDVDRRLPGRGAHVHPTLQCLERAEQRRAFPRALRVAGPLDLSALHAMIGAGQEHSSSGSGQPSGPTSGDDPSSPTSGSGVIRG